MAELPQTRKVELLVSDVDVLSPCCSCREKEGVLKCSGCKAVVYCGQECQEKEWIHHKDVCNEIKQLLQQAKAAIEALANEYGGVETLLESPLVTGGHFRFLDQFLPWEDFMFHNNNYPIKPQEYEIARWKLITAYARCGKEASSKLAFRLAAENLLHMIQLCRNGGHPYVRELSPVTEFTSYKYCGWLVAGEMDQLALNFLGFIHTKDGGFIRISAITLDQEDIEGLSVVSRVKERVKPRFKVHYFMLISLIKFKRIKALSVLRKEEEERWQTFKEGTQSRSGESSVVLILSGMEPVLEKLKEFIVDKAIDERIDSLTNQVNDLLMEVNKENPKLIRGVLDRQMQMVDNSTLPEMDDNREYNSHSVFFDIPDDEREIHIARFAVRNYGHAWHTDNDCTRALRLFLETGNVMAEEEEEEGTSPETGTAEEDTSPESGTPEEDTSPQTKMEKENTIPEIGIAEKKDNSPGIKVDEAMSDDRESDGENSVEEKEGLDLSEFCDNDNEFKTFGGKVTEKEDKGFKDDNDKSEESSY